jgi:catechol 2,3-dioxygenase-like lactoylglutathione lyase family enzyme
MTVKFENVRLLVDKFDECFLFYRDVMGLKVTWGQEGAGYASFELPGKGKLAIFLKDQQAKALGTSELPAQAKVQDRFMLVFRSRNVDKRVRSLKEKGAKLIGCVEDRPGWGIRVAYFRDPDGNLIEVHSPLPKKKWSKELLEESAKYSDK